jgi:tight adherence protein C
MMPLIVLFVPLSFLALALGAWWLRQDGIHRKELLRAGAAERRADLHVKSQGRPLPSWLRQVVRLCTPLGMALIGPGGDEAVATQLGAAGHPMRLSAPEFVGLRVAAAIALGLMGLVLRSPLLALPLCVGGWVIVGQWLAGQIANRQARIRTDLPDFLDCVAVSLAAGAPIETALQDVTGRFDGPLADEFHQILAQMQLGVPKQQAFRQAADRARSRELEAVITSLVHGMQLGVPLAESMQLQAKAMRNLRAQQARQMAGAAAPKITLITTLLITPAVMYLIVGLLILNFALSSEFSGFRGLLGM